jgi:hypothetical protein
MSKKDQKIVSLEAQITNLVSSDKFTKAKLQNLHNEVVVRRLLDDINDIGLDAPRYEDLSSDVVNGLTQELAKAAFEIPRLLNTISDIDRWPFDPKRS